MNSSVARPRRARAILAVLGAVAVLGVGCQSLRSWTATERSDQTVTTEPAEGGDRPVPGGRLIVAVPSESNGWNPFIDQWADSGTLIGSSMVEALAVQANDGTAQPWLAEKWQPNADFTEWDITLRPDVYFHDNTRMDAEAVKKSLDESFQSGLYEVALGPLYKKVEVIGPLTVRVYLKVRWAQYPTSLANQWVLAPSMLAQTDKGVVHPTGTGPFRFSEWKQGRSLVVTRFDNYWRKGSTGRSLPYLDRIEFRTIPGDSTREDALRSGDVDVAYSTGSDIALHLESTFNVIKDYTGQRTYLMLNTATGAANKGNPFNNAHARRALALATDRRRIADRVGTGVQTTPFGFRPDSPWAPQGGDGYPVYDPEAARREIELYRRETGATKLRFTLTGMTDLEINTRLHDLQAMWAEVGIVADIDTVETPKLTVLAALGQFHAVWFRMWDFPDPDEMNFYQVSTNVHPVGELSLNFTHYTSKDLDANLKILRESLDPDARKRASDAIIRETNEKVTNLWLFDTPASLISRREVRGLDGFVTHGFSNNLPKPWLADAWHGDN